MENKKKICELYKYVVTWPDSGAVSIGKRMRELFPWLLENLSTNSDTDVDEMCPHIDEEYHSDQCFFCSSNKPILKDGQICPHCLRVVDDCLCKCTCGASIWQCNGH